MATTQFQERSPFNITAKIAELRDCPFSLVRKEHQRKLDNLICNIKNAKYELLKKASISGQAYYDMLKAYYYFKQASKHHKKPINEDEDNNRLIDNHNYPLYTNKEKKIDEALRLIEQATIAVNLAYSDYHDNEYKLVLDIIKRDLLLSDEYKEILEKQHEVLNKIIKQPDTYLDYIKEIPIHVQVHRLGRFIDHDDKCYELDEIIAKHFNNDNQVRIKQTCEDISLELAEDKQQHKDTIHNTAKRHICGHMLNHKFAPASANLNTNLQSENEKYEHILSMFNPKLSNNSNIMALLCNSTHHQTVIEQHIQIILESNNIIDKLINSHNVSNTFESNLNYRRPLSPTV